MKTLKKCPRCSKSKQLKDFSSNGWCKVCAREYLRVYKSKRLDFSETILTEKDMRGELRSIKKIDVKGLNALSFLTEQFDKASKIKSYGECKKIKFNRNSLKALKYQQLVLKLIN